MTKLETSPKYISIADSIEKLMLSGEWDGQRIPSVRGIAKQYHVSIVTASRALQVLRDKGLVQTIERSGCYRIPPPNPKRMALCLHLTPGPWHHLTAALLRRGFENLSKSIPVVFDLLAFDIRVGLSVEEARISAETALANELEGVVLLPTRISDEIAQAEENFIRGCQQAGLPIVLIERNLRGHRRALLCDLICIDDLQGSAAMTQHLFDQGCKRVGIIGSSPTSSHENRIAGYLGCLQSLMIQSGGKKIPPSPLIIYHDSSIDPRASYVTLCDEVLNQKLDGVVCYSDYTAVGLMVELTRRGKKVPEQVAVVGFDNLPVGEFVTGGLTTLDFPTDEMAHHAVRMIEERRKQPEAKPIQVTIPGDLIVRGSSTKAKKPVSPE
jgi:LacI family transcriptional regulator